MTRIEQILRDVPMSLDERQAIIIAVRHCSRMSRDEAALATGSYWLSEWVGLAAEGTEGDE